MATTVNQTPKTPEKKTEKLSLEAVKKVAQLSRLKLTEGELASIRNQLTAVLENFEQISQVNTDGVRPLVTPTEITQVLRADVAEAFDSEKIVANAPEKAGRLFKVPPVV